MSGHSELSRLTNVRSFSLAEGLTTVCGQEFLGWLTRYLVEVTGLDHALIWEFSEFDSRRTQLRAAASRDGSESARIPDSAQFPFRELPDAGFFAYAAGAGEAFRTVAAVEAGAGVLVRDTHGAPLGALALFHGQPVTDIESVLATLRLFDARLGGELELMRAARCVELLAESSEGLAPEDGLARQLVGVSRALGVKVVFLAELLDQHALTSRTIALTVDGQPQAEIAYEMRGTPCEYVLRTADAFHRSGLRKAYPHDRFLAQVGAESYYSLAFHGPDGQPVGHLGVMHDAALPDHVRHSPLLKTLALRGRDAVLKSAARRRAGDTIAGSSGGPERQSRAHTDDGIIHDLSNLFAALLGSTSLLLDSAADAEIRRHAVRTQAIAERAHRLLNHLLNRLGYDRMGTTHVEFNQLVEETIDVLQSRFDGHVHVEREFDPALPAVEGSAVELGQLVMNIVLNALQACGANGRVRITTSVERLDRDDFRRFAIGSSLPEGAYACIAVADTGLGIPMEIRSRIFDPQFTTRVHGRGLGLAVVKQIAQRHGIAIAIESEPGKGSVFRAFIPLRAGVTGI